MPREPSLKNQSPSKGDAGASVTVVITTYNHARYLPEALRSAVNQSVPADKIIVVDDGSTDNPGAVVAEFPGVELIRQHNQGLAAARNRGLKESATKFIIFLDADDILEPVAIEAGLRCFEESPECGFVYGAHRHVTADGDQLWGKRIDPLSDDPYRQLLTGNFIAMHATVMYRRDRLVEIGGFDVELRKCEDYDLYLRLARRYPVAAHESLVASYRWHGENMSADAVRMLDAALLVHGRQRGIASQTSEGLVAWRDGRNRWRRYYGHEIMKDAHRAVRQDHSLSRALSLIAAAAVRAPGTVVLTSLFGLVRAGKRLVPEAVAKRLFRRNRN